jgi:cysteine desulfuration protein SufE
MVGAMATLDDIVADFELIDDWEERYRYLIELGKALPPLPEAERNDITKVRGCASQVWLVSRVAREAGVTRLYLAGESDAHIVRGLVALVIALYSGRPVDEIAGLDPEPLFTRIGLREHLTPQRSNGVNAMIERIRADARAAAASV